MLNTASDTIIVLVALVTSLMAPPILRYAMNRVEQERPAEPAESPESPPAPEPEPDTAPALR